MKYQPTQEELKSIQQRKNLKKALKSLASKIRLQKQLRKKRHPQHDQFIGNWELQEQSLRFRYMHVAYCLLRGTPLYEIDKNADALSMQKIEFIQRAAHPDSKEKLYVEVDSDLSPSQMAVQASHATAEFVIRNPESLWTNGTIVLLKSRSKGYVLYPWREDMIRWREPDLKNRITAAAYFGHTCQEFFKDFDLV